MNLKKKAWWLEAEIDVFFKTNHLISSWFRGEYCTPGSNHITRFPWPGYAHTGLLGDRCRPIAGCCHCRVCFNISSIVLRHKIGFPWFSDNHCQFQLSSNVFFCYHQILSRVNSSHGLMDLNKTGNEHPGISSQIPNGNPFFLKFISFNVRNWQWDEAKYPKSRSIPDMLTYAMPWSSASCCFGVGDKMCSQDFVLLKVEWRWVKYFWI